MCSTTAFGWTCDTSSAIWRTDQDSVNWLKTRNSPSSAGLSSASSTQASVSRMSIMPSGLAALAVDGEGVPDDGLDAETVEDRPEHAVVVEPGCEVRVKRGLLGHLAVHDALVEVRRTDSPDATGELDVVAVVDLGQVVEGPRPLRVRQDVGPALVGDLDESLFDVDVGSPVLAHRAELHEMDRRGPARRSRREG